MVPKVLVAVPLATLLLPVLTAAFVPSYLQADLAMTRSASDVVYEVPFPGWPEGIVPYVLSERFRPSDVRLLRDFMDYIMNNSCVQFVERTNHTAYLHIVTSMDEAGSDFFSFMYTGERSVMIMPPPALPLRGPSVLLLTLGFAPEHTRGDRDEHIYFNCSLCPVNFKTMMQKRYKMSVDLKYPYDGQSMTHIGTDEVKKINALMWALDRNKTTFNAKQESLSEIDLKKLDYFYNCSVPLDGSSGDGSGSSGPGDGLSGTGNGLSSSGDGLSGSDGGPSGLGDGSFGTDVGSSGTGDGLSGTEGGSPGTGDGLFGIDVGSSSTEGGSSGTGDGFISIDGGSSGTGDGSYGTDVGSSSPEGGSSGTSIGSLSPDEVGSSGSVTDMASGYGLGVANFRNSSFNQTGAGSSTHSGAVSGTGVSVIGTGESGSGESSFQDLGSSSRPEIFLTTSSGGGSDVANLIDGPAGSSQAFVDPVLILGGSRKVWNGATFVDMNYSVSVVHATNPPMNFSLMIISSLNSADKFVSSGPMTAVTSLLVWILHLLLK